MEPPLAPNTFKWPVFQAGPRVCLGMTMATIELKMLTALIVRDFRLLPPSGARAPSRGNMFDGAVPVGARKMRYKSGLTLALKHGLPLTVEKRR